MLELSNLHVAYGSLGVVRGIDLTVREGEIVTVLGSNGAGKTTTLRAIAGLHRPSGGRVVFAGRDITGLPAHVVAAAGLVLVPEGRQLFPEHTVLENLELGAYARLMGGKRREFEQDLKEVFELFPRVRERAAQPAGTLSGGEQQMVAIARALVGRPRLLLLDEPSLGLAPLLVKAIFETFDKLRARGMTLVLVEQMAHLALRTCDRAYVLDHGTIVAEGPREEIIANRRVLEAYLGKEAV